jgi:hypothetical protein
MSKRKRTLLAVGLLVAMAALAAVGIALIPRDRTPPELQRVQLGMTQDEVATAMGRQHDGAGGGFVDSRYRGKTLGQTRVWRTPGGSIHVDFYDEGR